MLAVAIVVGGPGSIGVALGSTLSGPNNAGTAANDSSTGAGTISWSLNSPFTLDGASSASVSLATNRTSKYLKLTGYSFSIPAGATIDGITVNVTRRTTAADAIKDAVVALVVNATTTASKADLNIFWPTTFGSKSYGGDSDSWGRTWTAAEINSTDFGLIISAENFDSSSSRTVHIDGATITVAYSVTYALTYTAGANGAITGALSQTVSEGASGTAVTAVADSGYHFVDWSDASTTMTRMDSNVTGDIIVTANFAIDAQAIDPMPPPNSSGRSGDYQRIRATGQVLGAFTEAERQARIAAIRAELVSLINQLLNLLQIELAVAVEAQ